MINYRTSEEKFIKNNMLYLHSDTYLYTDEAKTSKVTTAELKKMFEGNILVDVGGGKLAKPITIERPSGSSGPDESAMIIIAVSEDGSSLVLKKGYSKEYSA